MFDETENIAVRLIDKIFDDNHRGQISYKVLSQSLVFIYAWNVDYQLVLKLQESLVQNVQENPLNKYFIFCSHPHVFTFGKGVRETSGSDFNLDLSRPKLDQLSFQTFEIHRGGGLTYHYPGQWIMYPILKLNSQNNTLNQHICWCLKMVSDTLSHMFEGINFKSLRNPLGIWAYNQENDKFKIASLGVGVKKFVTIHGLALNFYHDQKMFDEIVKLNPCGLSGEIYTSLSNFLDREDLKKDASLREQFQGKIEELICNRFDLVS